MDLAASLRGIGIIPVVEISDAADAGPLVEALDTAGLPCAEITFRTAAGAAAIRAARRAIPGLLLGAGTVLTPDQVDQASDAGATFVVTPGFNPKVVARCRARGLQVIPGVATPTEVEMAHAEGLRVLKFFPAEAAGGVPYLRALSGPYRDVTFIPTGGIDLRNLSSYLALPNVVACGGSWIATRELIDRRDFDTIGRLAAKAVAAVKAARTGTGARA